MKETPANSEGTNNNRPLPSLPVSEQDHISGIKSRIKSLRRKVALWFLVDGLSRLVIILLLYLAFTFWVDYLIRDLPIPLRLCFLALAIATAAFTLIKKTVLPITRLNKISNDSLIFLIEKQFPALKERLINLWQLPASTASSELAQEVIPAAHSYNFTEILFPSSSRKLFLGALTLVMLSIISVNFYPSELGIWGKRLMGRNLNWPKRTLLAVKVSPDYTIARGQNLSVMAWPAKGPRLSAVYIRIEQSGSRDSSQLQDWERLLMTQTKDHKTEFRYDFNRVQAPFRFMLKGGDDQTSWIEINVLEAPALEKISVSYDYPPYTGMENKTELGGNIKAPVGTKATINAVSSANLQSASLLLDSLSIPLALENNISVSATLIAEKDAKYSLNLMGTNGLKNLEPIEYSIKTIPDNHPTIKVIDPPNEIQYVTPGANITLKAIISDDYGISDSRIIYSGVNEAAAESRLFRDNITGTYQTFYVYSGPFSNKIELSATLDLTPLDLKDGAYLTVNFIATDNCQVPAPQTITSPDYSLIIISQPQMAKRIEEAIMQLKDDLKKTVQIQDAARQAPEIQQALANQRRVSQNLNSDTALLSDIIKDIDNNKMFSPDIADKLKAARETLGELADTKSPAAQQSLEKIAQSKNGANQDQAKAQQQEISNDLKDILASLEEWEDYQEVVNNVRDLLAETQNLSERIKKPASDEPSSRELEKERLNEQARNLRKESDNLAKKMSRVADKLKETHPYYSEKLTQGLEKLKDADGLNPNILSLLSNLDSALTGQAIKDTENIKNTLSGLLNFLEDRVNPEEIQKKLAELKKAMEQVSQLKNQEEKLADDTAKILDPTGQLSAVAQELDSLLMDQKALNEITEKALAEPNQEKLADIMKKLAQEQQSLKDQAKDMADRLAQVNAQIKPSNPDVQSAGKSLQSSSEKMSQASQNMEKSDQQPSAENKQQAAADQKDALQDLRQARESLKKVLNRPLTEEEKRKLERLAQRQKEIKEDAQKSAKESGKDSQESLQSAAQKMSKAQQNLSDNQPQEAQENEQAAMEELERLYEMLADKIDELEQRKKQDQLEKLHAMLKRVLDAQSNINLRTSEMFDKPTLDRADTLDLKKLAGQQIQLADNTLEIKKKLDSEKSQTFSWMLGSIRDDMQTAAKLLAGPSPRNDADYIQEIQANLKKTLKDLLDAFKHEMNQRKPLQADAGEMGQMDDGKLMSLYAELNMAKTIQEYLIYRTESIKKELLKDGADNPTLNTLLQRLASEQGHLADMIKELTKLIKEQQAKKQKS